MVIDRPLTREPATGGRAGRAVLAALAGHAIEWYEFGVYGVVAVYLARALFPSDDLGIALLGTWSAFAAAFLIRPLGGVVLSHLGDRYGRRAALFASVTLMSGATFLMGVLPGSDSVGVLAVVLLVGLRLVQGFAVGGEMGSAVTLVYENTRPGNRVRASSWLAAGTFTALLCGSLLASAIAASLSEEAMVEWGWRVLFLFALPLGLVAVWVRRSIVEPSAALGAEADAVPRLPIVEVIRSQKRAVGRYLAIGVAFNVGVSFALAGYTNLMVLNGIAPAEAV
ncbi:MFS transporter [Agromyces albus]|uniref:MFS transporter n=1 Tax=Agromyces albus TaxID=205332 RepID=A0A4Q2L2M4_9MICO|nr:MFS transporter [Agromyces albus]RXZ72365.1 MFS transporter [Agromyces albus]